MIKYYETEYGYIIEIEADMYNYRNTILQNSLKFLSILNTTLIFITEKFIIKLGNTVLNSLTLFIK